MLDRPVECPSPFCLPSETDGRFRMLVVAAVVLWAGTLALVVGGPAVLTAGAAARSSAPWVLREASHTDIVHIDEHRLRGLAQRAGPVVRTLWQGLAPSVAAAALLLAAVMAAAWGLYRAHPWCRRLRLRPRPLAEDEAPGLVRELRGLAARYGVRMPALQWRSGLLGGLAYGVRGREALLLWGLPRVLASAWPGPARAVTLHEFAHVVNRDAHLREWSRAIWTALGCGFAGLALAAWATRAAGAIGFLEMLAGRPALAANCAGLVLMVLWIWIDLVRAREHYADLRVAEWGAGPALERVLAIAPAGARFHPSPARRLQRLSDPRPLFEVSRGVALQTGLLLGLSVALAPWILYGVNLLTLLVVEPRLLEASTQLVRFGAAGRLVLVAATVVWRTVLLPAPWLVSLAALVHLATRVLGLQVQREALADLALRDRRSWRYLPLARHAFLLAVGIEAGFLVAPWTPWTPASGASLARAAAWLPWWTLLNWLWLVYVRATARFTLGTHAGSRAPTRHARLLGWAATLTLLLVFTPALFNRVTLPFAESILLRHPVLLMSDGLTAAERYVVLVVVTAAILTVVTLALFGAVASASWAATLLWLRVRPWRCPSCGDPFRGFAVGLRCDGCDEPLAAWTLPPAQPALAQAAA